jgi:hypothetical protein
MEKVNLEPQYNLLVAALEKKKVPCRVKLNEWSGPNAGQDISVECGWDYPDRIFDKVCDCYGKIEGLNSQNVSVCADSGGSVIVLKSTRIAGGPKRY